MGSHATIFREKCGKQLEATMSCRNIFRFSLWSGCCETLVHATISHAQVVERILDKGDLIRKTVEDVAHTKAEATEHVVFMVVTGVVLSVALIAAALYFRGPPPKQQ